MKKRVRCHVALMGLDGTGKSTQAALLAEYLHSQGWKPIIVHHCTPLLSPIRALKGLLHQSLIRHFKRTGTHLEYESDKGRQASGKGFSRFLARLISWQLITAGLVRSWYHYWRHSRRGLISDRCFLDDVVKARWRFGTGRRLGQALLAQAPRPDLLVVFEAPTRLSYQRKKVSNCTYSEYQAKREVMQAVLELAQAQGWRISKVPVEGHQIPEVAIAVRAQVEAAIPLTSLDRLELGERGNL